MAGLATLREKYPEYNDLNDEQLALGFYNTYYSDLDWNDYAQKMGLAPGPEAFQPEPPPPEPPHADIAMGDLGLGSPEVGELVDKSPRPPGFPADLYPEEIRQAREMEAIPEELETVSRREKGPGYFGPLPTTDGTGRESTEISMGFDWGEGEMDIPLLVPGLTRQEIDHLLAGNDPTAEIIDKAVTHARQRRYMGQSPFAQPGEQADLPLKGVPIEADYTDVPVGEGLLEIAAKPFEAGRQFGRAGVVEAVPEAFIGRETPRRTVTQPPEPSPRLPDEPLDVHEAVDYGTRAITEEPGGIEYLKETAGKASLSDFTGKAARELWEHVYRTSKGPKKTVFKVDGLDEMRPGDFGEMFGRLVAEETAAIGGVSMMQRVLFGSASMLDSWLYSRLRPTIENTKQLATVASQTGKQIRGILDKLERPVGPGLEPGEQATLFEKFEQTMGFRHPKDLRPGPQTPWTRTQPPGVEPEFAREFPDVEGVPPHMVDERGFVSDVFPPAGPVGSREFAVPPIVEPGATPGPVPLLELPPSIEAAYGPLQKGESAFWMPEIDYSIFSPQLAAKLNMKILPWPADVPPPYVLGPNRGFLVVGPGELITPFLPDTELPTPPEPGTFEPGEPTPESVVTPEPTISGQEARDMLAAVGPLGTLRKEPPVPTEGRTKQRKAKTLLGAIRMNGGIWDPSLKGEVKDLLESLGPGWLDKETGIGLDEMATALQEDQWMAPFDDDPTGTLLALLEQEAKALVAERTPGLFPEGGAPRVLTPDQVGGTAEVDLGPEEPLHDEAAGPLQVYEQLLTDNAGDEVARKALQKEFLEDYPELKNELKAVDERVAKYFPPGRTVDDAFEATIGRRMDEAAKAARRRVADKAFDVVEAEAKELPPARTKAEIEAAKRKVIEEVEKEPEPVAEPPEGWTVKKRGKKFEIRRPDGSLFGFRKTRADAVDYAETAARMAAEEPVAEPELSEDAQAVADIIEGKAAPVDIKEYVTIEELRKEYRANYFDEKGEKIASSREVPAKVKELPVGTWRIDDFQGIHGRDVSELRMVDPKDLIDVERPEKNRPVDVAKYRKWRKEGKVPPPIEVVETVRGKLKIVDGHRRAAAAKQAGLDIPAWVSPVGDHPEGLTDAAGKIQKVGLTYEMVAGEAPTKADVPGIRQTVTEKRREGVKTKVERYKIFPEEGPPRLPPERKYTREVLEKSPQLSVGNFLRDLRKERPGVPTKELQGDAKARRDKMIRMLLELSDEQVGQILKGNMATVRAELETERHAKIDQRTVQGDMFAAEVPGQADLFEAKPTEAPAQTEKEALVRRIAEATREPVPVIRPVVELKASDGKWYGPGGFPLGVKHTGEKRTVGYAYSKDGVLYGTRGKSEQELIARHNKLQDERVEDFYNEVIKSSDADIQRQAKYWLKEEVPAEPVEAAPEVTEEVAESVEVFPGDYVKFRTKGGQERFGDVSSVKDDTVYVIPDGGKNPVPAGEVVSVERPGRKGERAATPAESMQVSEKIASAKTNEKFIGQIETYLKDKAPKTAAQINSALKFDNSKPYLERGVEEGRLVQEFDKGGTPVYSAAVDVIRGILGDESGQWKIWEKAVKEGDTEKARRTLESMTKEAMEPTEAQLDQASTKYLETGKMKDFRDAVPGSYEAAPKPDPQEQIPFVAPDLPPPTDLAHQEALKGFSKEIEGFKDISRTAERTQDPIRLFQTMDQGYSGSKKHKRGPFQRYGSWPARRTEVARMKFVDKNFDAIAREMDALDIHSLKKKKAAFQVAQHVDNKNAWDKDVDSILKIGGVKKALQKFNPKVRRQIVEFAQFYRRTATILRAQDNAMRKKQGRPEIKWRNRYVTKQMRNLNIAEALFRYVGEKKDLISKPGAVDIYGAQKPPEAAYFPHELPQGMKEYPREENLVKLLADYAVAVSRDIYDTNIIQHYKALAAEAREQGLTNTANAIETHAAEVYGGVTTPFTREMRNIVGERPEIWLRGIRKRLNRAVFPFNWTWNLGVQTSSSALTQLRYGTLRMVQGMEYFVNPEMHRWVKNNAYSSIVKSRWGGGMAYQDVADSIVKNRRLQGTKMDTFDQWMNVITSTIEDALTGQAIVAAYHEGKKLGLEGRALAEFASEGGAKTQSMYHYGGVPGLLRDPYVKGLFPFQTFFFEVKSTIQEVVPDTIAIFTGRAGAYETIAASSAEGKAELRRRVWKLARFWAYFTAFNMVADKAFGRKPWQWYSPIPMAALFGLGIRRMSPFMPIQYGIDFSRGIKDVLKWDDYSKLINWTLRYHFYAGVQLSRILRGIEAVAKGKHQYDVRGHSYPVTGTMEEIKAITMGPEGTKEGRERTKKRKESKEILEYKEVAPGVRVPVGIKKGKKAGSGGRSRRSRSRRRAR